MKRLNFKKNSRIWLSWFLTAIFFSSCTVLSFYPFYTKDVLITDNRLTGKWIVSDENIHEAADTMIWEIELRNEKWDKKPNSPTDRGSGKEPNAMTYTLIIYESSDPDHTTEFNLHLMEVNGQKYLDFYPENWNIDSDLLELHMMPAHSLAKVEMQDTLKLKWLDIEWFQEMLDENRIRIRHEQNNNYSLLTAKPEELQKFIQKYGKDNEAWKEGFEHTLVKVQS